MGGRRVDEQSLNETLKADNKRLAEKVLYLEQIVNSYIDKEIAQPIKDMIVCDVCANNLKDER